MTETKLTRTVTLTNDEGFHLRAATVVMVVANRYKSKIALVRKNHSVDGKATPLQLVGLGALQGDQLRIEAEGPDAAAALDALVEVFAAHFPDQPEFSGKTEANPAVCEGSGEKASGS
ncbi:MAG: HPr family phosphocarrier protein [Pirellulales bacterium]|nr:HPr family phosphocarrier protein [Pirellulales bacterium]